MLVAPLILAANLAQSAVLNFDGNICGSGTQACNNGSNISQSYGDTANLDVIWDANTATAGSQDFLFWSTGYSGQSNIAYNISGANGEIFLKPNAGFQVTLNSFDIGSWLSATRTTQVSIFDGATNAQLFSSGPITFNSLQLFTFNLLSANGLKINLGPDAFNTGIDNINFTVSQVNAIPVPAAAWLFGSALFGFFGLRKRQTV